MVHVVTTNIMYTHGKNLTIPGPLIIILYINLIKGSGGHKGNGSTHTQVI